MTECSVSDNLQEKECIDKMTGKNRDISEVIEQVIKQVELQKLEVPSGLNSSNTEIFLASGPDKSKTANNFKSTDSSAERSKRHRSGSRKYKGGHKKYKWKPYCKLTWEERKRVEERDSRRAYRSREKMSASGLTLAPYNTTQFLMEDHNLQEPDYASIHHSSKIKEDCHSFDSEEDYYSSPEDEQEFLHQQFSEAYDSVRDVYINGLSKFKLVQELMLLEDKIEGVEKALKECRDQKKILSECPCLDVEAEMAKIQVFKDEIEKLTQENIMLEKNNELLQNRLSTVKSK